MEHRYWGSTTGTEKFHMDDLLDCAINSRHDYKPSFIFYASDLDDSSRPFYGIELEVNTPSTDSRANARTLLMGVNHAKRHFYCKRDGSLQTGFEFNSMPMTMEYMEQTFDVSYMNAIFESSEVFTRDDCGFHVHISRDSFRDLAKFHTSMYNILPFLLYISGRADYGQILQYASPLIDNYNEKEYTKLLSGSCKFYAHTKRTKPVMLKPSVAQLENQGRYTFINYVNDKTVEIRLFKGTTDWANVRFTVRLLDYIKSFSDKGVIIQDVSVLTDKKHLTGQPDWFKTELQDRLNKMSRDLLRAFWNQKRGLLYNRDDHFSFYRIPFKNLKVGDLCFAKKDIKSSLRSTDSEKVMYDLMGNSLTYEVIKTGKQVKVLRKAPYSNTTILTLTESDKDYVYFTRVLHVLAPASNDNNANFFTEICKAMYGYKEVKELKTNSVAKSFLERMYSGETVQAGNLDLSGHVHIRRELSSMPTYILDPWEDDSEPNEAPDWYDHTAPTRLDDGVADWTPVDDLTWRTNDYANGYILSYGCNQEDFAVSLSRSGDGTISGNSLADYFIDFNAGGSDIWGIKVSDLIQGANYRMEKVRRSTINLPPYVRELIRTLFGKEVISDLANSLIDHA